MLLPVSELNRLRRELVIELDRLRARPKRWTLTGAESRPPEAGAGPAPAGLTAGLNDPQLSVLVRSLARTLSLSFSRIQFTPDLMPADVIGSTVIVQDAAQAYGLRFEPGPVFAHLVLAVDDKSFVLPEFAHRPVTASEIFQRIHAHRA